MKVQSSFVIASITPGSRENPLTVVTLRDLDGNKSITNDAENVVAYIYEQYGANVRIMYYDTEGELGELRHNNGIFTGFNIS